MVEMGCSTDHTSISTGPTPLPVSRQDWIPLDWHRAPTLVGAPLWVGVRVRASGIYYVL